MIYTLQALEDLVISLQHRIEALEAVNAPQATPETNPATTAST